MKFTCPLPAAHVLASTRPHSMSSLAFACALGMQPVNPLFNLHRTALPIQVLALRILAGVCLHALNGFPTALGEDDVAIEAALQGRTPLPADELLATQFRAEKKRVLYDALAAIAARIKVRSSEGIYRTLRLHYSIWQLLPHAVLPC